MPAPPEISELNWLITFGHEYPGLFCLAWLICLLLWLHALKNIH